MVGKVDNENTDNKKIMTCVSIAMIHIQNCLHPFLIRIILFFPNLVILNILTF